MQGIGCSGTSGVTSLSLSGVSASGPLPSSWSITLPNLTSLDLSGNTLSGSLPNAWAAMTALTLLNLKGKCPSTAAPPLPAPPSHCCTALSVVPPPTLALTASPLQGNGRISGPLPANWRALVSLADLDLAHNLISGPLPAVWGAMTVREGGRGKWVPAAVGPERRRGGRLLCI